MHEPARPLVLASASAARRALLRAAGLEFTVVPSAVDESVLKQQRVETSPAGLAATLAAAKARDVAAKIPDALVIGADQVLDLDGRTFDKPSSRDEARDHLKMLRGRTHVLHAAVALVRSDDIVWEYVGTARLTMRSFSDVFLEEYLDKAGDNVLASVGAYQLEDLGIQLFEAIDGDHATILGLPMLPLLSELRRMGAITA